MTMNDARTLKKQLEKALAAVAETKESHQVEQQARLYANHLPVSWDNKTLDACEEAFADGAKWALQTYRDSPVHRQEIEYQTARAEKAEAALRTLEGRIKEAYLLCDYHIGESLNRHYQKAFKEIQAELYDTEESSHDTCPTCGNPMRAVTARTKDEAFKCDYCDKCKQGFEQSGNIGCLPPGTTVPDPGPTIKPLQTTNAEHMRDVTVYPHVSIRGPHHFCPKRPGMVMLHEAKDCPDCSATEDKCAWGVTNCKCTDGKREKSTEDSRDE